MNQEQYAGIVSSARANIQHRVASERLHQASGRWPAAHDDKHTGPEWMNIIVSQLGHVAWSIEEFSNDPDDLSTTPGQGDMDLVVIDHLVHVAAVASAAAEAYLRRYHRRLEFLSDNPGQLDQDVPPVEAV